MKASQVNELLYQALETEIGGQQIYREAVECAKHEELREEWQKYLAETTEHARILRETFARIGLDPEVETPGRVVVREKAAGLIGAMRKARRDGGDVAGQLCAAESVVEAETKDHQNWALIGRVAEASKGTMAAALKEAHAQVEEQEDEHLYHTMGWARELWLQALGLPAVLPPPEEAKQVKTAIGAARAEQSREAMLR